MHRLLPQGVALDAVLSIETPHALRNDFTVAYNSRLYQIEDNVNAEKVTVEERANGSIHISYRNMDLKFKEITTRPKKQQKEPQSPKGPYFLQERPLGGVLVYRIHQGFKREKKL